MIKLTTIALLVTTSLTAHSAGFNCKKASTIIEQLICKDKQLSLLDDELNASYKSAMSLSEDRSNLKFEQRFWRESVRDTCTDLNCLHAAYHKRISELAALQPSISRDITYESQQGSGDLPLIESGGVFEVPILVNGVLKINFIIDSGASDVSISPDVAMTLIKTGTVTDQDWLPGRTYRFADGSSAKSARFILRSLQIGDKTLRSITCSIANSIEAPMLLGQSALSKLGGYNIDYKKRVLNLR